MAELKLPELGENISQGTVTKILVKPGDTIKNGQNILELETEKAVLEVPSTVEGVVAEILIKNGTVIKVGQSILTFKEGAAAPHVKGDSPLLNSDKGTAPFNAAPSSVPTSVVASEAKQSFATDKKIASSPSAPRNDTPVRANVPAAPSVRLLARELGIDIAQVPGSGSGGRISADDVKAYCKKLNTSSAVGGAGRLGSVTAGAATPPLPDFGKWGQTRREPMNNVRKKTAEHLSMAWGAIPHVSQFDKADITELEKSRRGIAGSKKISVTPFIIKVVAAALKKFPQFNASIDMHTQEIIYKDYINIGVAVDTDRGLLVPVLKNADKMSIFQISDELTAMAERARLRKTPLEEMQGGCFSISNLGGIGGAFFTPIVNWPEVAILGISRANLEGVYMDGHFIPRSMLPLSLSYDHRLIDGADGARFIRFICEALQQPFLLDMQK